MTSPLPLGCQFFIWPETARRRRIKPYFIIFHGRVVRLSDLQAQILLILMAFKGRRFSARCIAEELYRNCPDGGPDSAIGLISLQIFKIRTKFRKEGLFIDLSVPPPGKGVSFNTITLLETATESVELP